MTKLTPTALAAFTMLLAAAACLALAPLWPWLTTWPANWSLPVPQWLGTFAGGAIALAKPLARSMAALLSLPMQAAQAVALGLPYPLMIGASMALSLWLGGWRLALGTGLGLGFVLASGYWVQGMNTLALVAVSVPLALLAGLALGVAAALWPSLRRPVQLLLDVMQTVPTFAYLTPLLGLFGFGPVVGLIASAIYAAPPMARNLLLGLDQLNPEIREAAIMAGTTRRQQLWLIELPAARVQLMVGVNQTIMAALSMVIIAAVIGGFDDIGWAVLLQMRKADFGGSLVSGMVIVVFAVLIDRMSAALGRDRPRSPLAARIGLVALGAALSPLAPAPDAALFAPLATALNTGLDQFTIAYGATLDGVKTAVMFYALLPLRIGLDQAVLPMTWGFAWGLPQSLLLYGSAGVAAALCWAKGRMGLGAALLLLAWALERGVADLPWPFVLTSAAALGWAGGGSRLAGFALAMLTPILLMGLWAPALLSLYLIAAALVLCTLLGGLLGALGAASPRAWSLILPACDFLQTIPVFIYLIPVLMLFQIGEFSAFLAICAYAVVPMIRYTRHGLAHTPEELVEAAIASGATPWQMVFELRLPMAMPAILLGVNQSILAAFSMLVVTALIGTTDLGQQIYLALGQGNQGLGLAAGTAMVLLALLADRLLQAFAIKHKTALGL